MPGKSSAVADERTATGASAPSSPYHRRIISAMSSGIVPCAKSDWICSDARSSVAGSFDLCLCRGGQNPVAEMVLIHKAAIGVGGDVKAGRNGQASRHHARKRCTLAAYPFECRLGAIQIENEWTCLR